MDELQINREKERPTQSEQVEIWNSVQLQRIDNWTSATSTLIETISQSHCNGGVQLHKYKINGNKHFEWFAQKNRLNEIEFPKKIFRHKDLSDYRNDLQIADNKPKVKVIDYCNDIYDLPGMLARIMGLEGGAYKRTDQKIAWTVACEFIKEEFENRFEEINFYYFVIKSAQWFRDVAWDYSILLFDKRKFEIIVIDITDTD